MTLDELENLPKGQYLRLLREVPPFKKGKFFRVMRETYPSKMINGTSQHFSNSAFLTLVPVYNPDIKPSCIDPIFRLGINGVSCLYFDLACIEDVLVYYRVEEKKRETEFVRTFFNVS